MVASIIEIASELAAQNPSASPEQITETIVRSLESEHTISDAISHVQIPTKLQILQAELRSKRSPKKMRTRILERIENANFFKKLQYIYILPIRDSNLRRIIHRDGARVDLSSPVKYSDSSHQKVFKSRYLGVDKTHEIIHTTKEAPLDYTHSVLTREIPARNTKAIKTSPSQVLREIDEESSSSHLLSLYNIYQIIRVMESSYNQDTILNEISNIVNNDIKVRNKVSGTSCIDELYQGNEFLPEELQIQRPSSHNIIDKIFETLRAIIVHEYKRRHDQYGQQFIKGQITHDMYIQTTNKYATDADELISELP